MGDGGETRDGSWETEQYIIKWIWHCIYNVFLNKLIDLLKNNTIYL